VHLRRREGALQFAAGQFFLAGVVEGFDYPNYGLSRAQAIADLELYHDPLLDIVP
jgi:hypothetical protein